MVESIALYDIRKLQNPGDYIELTISLSQKDKYLEPAVGNPHANAGTGGMGEALDITKYLKELIVYGNGDSELYIMSEDHGLDETKNGEANTASETVNESSVIVRKGELNSAKDQITIRVKRSLLKPRGGADSGIYEIPIDFKVLTGDDNFNARTNGLKYSNYMISITTAIYNDISTTEYTSSSYEYDYMIYTNAKLDPAVQ